MPPVRRTRKVAKRTIRKAFTLVEVLLVLIILVIIGSIVVPNIFGAKDQADRNAAKTQITNLKAAIRLYRLNMNKYPTALKDLRERPSDKAEADKWGSPYLEEDLKQDPWGNEYQYLAQGKKNADGFDLWSNGPDGQSGTDDDIGNWE
jgi:general secretion pathway protein G